MSMITESYIRNLCSVLRRRVAFRLVTRTFKICHVVIPSKYAKLSRVALRTARSLRATTRNSNSEWQDFLAQDEQAYVDVREGTDVHSYTAGVIGCSRQEAKAHTFKPLYGGTTGTEAQQRYYRAFKEKYGGVSTWHEDLQREAVEKRVVTLPSGRQYAFPDARWTKYGTATHRTNICNYPVQGFATADLLPAALVRLDRAIHRKQSAVCDM